jgi:hypothetical protein
MWYSLAWAAEHCNLARRMPNLLMIYEGRNRRTTRPPAAFHRRSHPGERGHLGVQHV